MDGAAIFTLIFLVPFLLLLLWIALRAWRGTPSRWSGARLDVVSDGDSFDWGGGG